MYYDELEIGDVLLLYCGHCTPPKPKYFIITVIEPEPILLFINSKLNNFIQNNPYLHPCHISIKYLEQNFLSHDSWVNCCEPCLEFSITDIERDLKYGGKHCGSLSNKGISNIIDGVKDSPVMKRKLKHRILNSLVLVK